MLCSALTLRDRLAVRRRRTITRLMVILDERLPNSQLAEKNHPAEPRSLMLSPCGIDCDDMTRGAKDSGADTVCSRHLSGLLGLSEQKELAWRRYAATIRTSRSTARSPHGSTLAQGTRCLPTVTIAMRLQRSALQIRDKWTADWSGRKDYSVVRTRSERRSIR